MLDVLDAPEAAMFLVQLSDMHVTTSDTPSGVALDPVGRLARAVDSLNGLDRCPDVVICTGDLVDVGTTTEYDLLLAELDRLESRWYVVAGNHDRADGFAEAFADRPEIPAEAPFQWVVDEHPLRLVGLDSTWPDRGDGALDADRLTWLADTLAEARDHPTLIAMHHPPLVTGMWWMDYGGCDGSAELRRIVEANPQVLRLLCGHIHRPVQTNWGSTIVSSAGALVLQSGLGLTPDSVPTLHDRSLRTPALIFDGSSIMSFELELEPSSFSVELADLIPDWASYERCARAGGPVPRGH